MENSPVLTVDLLARLMSQAPSGPDLTPYRASTRARKAHLLTTCGNQSFVWCGAVKAPSFAQGAPADEESPVCPACWRYAQHPVMASLYKLTPDQIFEGKLTWEVTNSDVEPFTIRLTITPRGPLTLVFSEHGENARVQNEIGLLVQGVIQRWNLDPASMVWIARRENLIAPAQSRDRWRLARTHRRGAPLTQPLTADHWADIHAGRSPHR